MLDFFKKTKSFFVAYQKTVILTIISSSLMIIFLKLKKKSKKLIDNNENLNIETLNKTNNISSQPKFQTKASFKEMSVKDLLELKAKDISKTIKIQYENNYLDYSTIHQIMEKTIILCQYEYNHQTEENRILRRLIMNQENEYEQEIFKYLSEINKIINEDSLLILNALQLNTDLLENSISYLKNNTEMNEKIIGLKNNVIHLLKQGLISKNCLNLNLNKEILKFQIELFKNKSSNFKKIVNDLKESFESA